MRRVRPRGRLRGERKDHGQEKELGLKFSPQYMLTPQPGTELRVLFFSIIFQQFHPFMKNQKKLQPIALLATVLAQVTEIYVVDQKPQQ